jgi:hypothetical protein
VRRPHGQPAARRHAAPHGARAALDLASLPAIDGHCHPLAPDPWAVDVEAFLDRLSEGRPGTMAAHVPHTGYFGRAVRELARRLGVLPAVETVLARRRLLGPDAARRILLESRVAAVLVDTGYPPEAMALDAMRALVPCPVHEVFRIETCAQALLPMSRSYERFLDSFRRALHEAAARAVALKTIVAYRSGLAIRAWDPADARRAYRQVIARVRAGGSPRLTEKPLLDTLVGIALEVAGETDRPLQIHTGFGDPDIDLVQANPLQLRPILEDPRRARARLVLLHMAYPYHREAAFMAAVWPQVYLDLSLALPFLGPGAVLPLVEILSLAPSSKLCYGSDVGGLPELFALSADWGRAALGEALGWLQARGGLTLEDARAAAARILSENAQALYRLPAGPTASAARPG